MNILEFENLEIGSHLVHCPSGEGKTKMNMNKSFLGTIGIKIRDILEFYYTGPHINTLVNIMY